jgi:hypothetical protein
VGLVVSRGYTSYTFKQEAINRFNEISNGSKFRRDPVLLYLGDLDPSGYDIYRCLKDEIKNADVVRLGLNVEDINRYGLVPNKKPDRNDDDPIKRDDTRKKGFQKMFPELGDDVYELDALPPGELVDRARRSILKYFNADMDEENKRHVRQWRANFTDYQVKIRKTLKKAGINLEN